MIKTSIIGVSGYSGVLLLELLLAHPGIRLTYLGTQTTEGRVDQIWPRFKGIASLSCEKLNIDKACLSADLFFLAVPHSAAMEIVPKLLKAKKRVIDLSADYRLKSKTEYEKWYDFKHSDPSNIAKSVYGLPEIYRENIKTADLIANPGCYPTAALLAIAPIALSLGNQIRSIIVDAKSGVSGAGRKVVPALLFSEVNENFKAYKVLSHQHTPEINLYLSNISGKPQNITFVAHLLPINRGILETIYIQMDEKVSENTVINLYKKFYKTEPFVRICDLGTQPEIKDVVGTNYCDIGIAVSREKNLIVITSVIDNLMKGAAGQAIQNMNIMYHFPEDKGLL